MVESAGRCGYRLGVPSVPWDHIPGSPITKDQQRRQPCGRLQPYRGPPPVNEQFNTQIFITKSSWNPCLRTRTLLTLSQESHGLPQSGRRPSQYCFHSGRMTKSLTLKGCTKRPCKFGCQPAHTFASSSCTSNFHFIRVHNSKQINITSTLTLYLQKSCNQRCPFYPWTCKGWSYSLSSCLTNSGRHQRVCPTDGYHCPLMIWKNPGSASPPVQRYGCTQYIKRMILLLIDCIRAM